MVDVFNRFKGARSTYGMKKPVRAATTTNITLSGFQTIDGITYASTDTNLNMRCLVKDQTDGTENGIYTVNSGNWTREVDFDGNTDFTRGTTVFVSQGSVNGNKVFYISSADPQDIGVDPISFTVVNLDQYTSVASSVPSASPLDLDSIAGQIVDVTAGAASIAAITLSAGKIRIVRFVTTVTLVNGASLVLPGSVNINAVSGDYGVFVGYTSGVVRCVSYTPAQTGSLANNSVTNAKLSQIPSLTIKGNNTGLTANVSDLTVTQVSGMLPAKYSAGGRLTLQSSTPVMSTSSIGSSIVYYSEYQSRVVPIYDGSNIVMTDVGGELQQFTTDATKSPSVVANTSVYDIFVWNDSGVFRATRGPAWTTVNTRSSGTDLSRVKGIYVNTYDITNGPAAQRGTYVGSVASNTSATIDFRFGGSASGGSDASLMVWNYYNRRLQSATVFDTGSSYAYSSTAVRQARASTGNQVAFLAGIVEDSFTGWTNSFLITGALANAYSVVGLGVDSVTAFTATGLVTFPSSVAYRGVGNSYWTALPGLGVRKCARLEQGDGTSTNTMASFGRDQLSFAFPM